MQAISVTAHLFLDLFDPFTQKATFTDATFVAVLCTASRTAYKHPLP